MRLDGRGLVERSRRLRFTFDGHRYEGHPGDTLASALLANGVRLVGRSFKYHRPRGIFTDGSAEPNALVTLGRGARREPNARATVTELVDGLEARSQNRFPSLGFDLMGAADLLHPFLGAGFYYKTFMWPRAFWERNYEPAIRRAAGLGALSGAPDPDRYETAFAHCDLLVIGAGPAGLMAALTAGRAGADVILADEDPRPGGRLNAETIEVDGLPGAIWAEETGAELAEMPNVRLMPRTAVTGAYDQGTYGALERLPGGAGRPDACFWRIVAKSAVLASGAQERPVAFPMNDRPGVMLASAVRGYLNRYGVAAGKSFVVFGNNDDAHRTALNLAEAGLHVAAVVDSRHEARPDGPFDVFAGAQVVGTRGGQSLEAVTLRHPDGRVESIAADCLAVSGGWNPSVHLACHMGARPAWDEGIAAFRPPSGAVPGMIAAGACDGAFSTRACLEAGAAAARQALSLGGATPEIPPTEDAPYAIRPLWLVEGRGRAWLDLQNDVTAKDVRGAAQENFRSVEHMKRYTTQGMAPDQGKTSNVGALAILADATGRSIPETGTTTFRPPYVPVPIGAMGAGGRGHGFAPERLTTSHRASLERGAPMVEAGLWFRPSWFPRPGETHWRQSCDREVGQVREAVGVTDVSTLGKIDVQGPDAARLLDFVYANRMSTLKPGRVRYGLILREDGHVMDDGTVARLGGQHYLVTTTTAAAGQVMRHLEYVHQVLRPEWDVSMTSVTEQWAQFAVAGPKARELLSGLVSGDLGGDAWPFMSCGELRISGVAARLFRISFSGELGFEVAVPARYGDSLFRLLVARAEGLGGGAYGMEALNVLRLEKGFLTHAELHGRTTAFDLGLEGMMSEAKDFVGRTMAARPGLTDPARERLVGLKPLGPVKQLTAGAHLFEPEAEAVRENGQGYVTSVGFSPTLGHFLGLAFLRHGPDRIGETVRLVDHMRGYETLCEVTHPLAFDPEGGRARG